MLLRICDENRKGKNAHRAAFAAHELITASVSTIK